MSSTHFWIVFCYISTTLGARVQYYFEDQQHQQKPHLHPLRKPGNVVSPYKSASSTITNTKSEKYESFSLNCPHVTDAANKDVNVEVTWTMNDTIWLKIENGIHSIANKLSTFTKKTVGGKSALRVLLNNGRYFFDYDEMTGEFSMEIHPVSHRHGVDEPKKVLPTTESQIFMVEREQNEVIPRSTHGKTSSFTRNDGGFVHINRDESIKYNTVVFSRQVPYLRNKVIKKIPDYEDEIIANLREIYDEHDRILNITEEIKEKSTFLETVFGIDPHRLQSAPDGYFHDPSLDQFAELDEPEIIDYLQ